MNAYQHPLASIQHATFDVLHGINAARNISETVEIARQKLARSNDAVLYINTLSSAAIVERECADLLKIIGDEPRFYIGHFFQAEVATKLDFLSKTIVARGIKTVIINSYEFAVSTSRHRIDLVVWMRALRDEHGVQVILSMMTAPGQTGLQQVMRFMSDSITGIGEYMSPGHSQRKLEFLSFQEYAKKSMEEYDRKQAALAKQEEEVEIKHEDRAIVTNDVAMLASSSSVSPEGALLKNKELTHAFVSHDPELVLSTQP